MLAIQMANIQVCLHAMRCCPPKDQDQVEDTEIPIPVSRGIQNAEDTESW